MERILLYIPEVRHRRSLSYHRIQSQTTDNQTDTEILPLSYNKVCSLINKLKSKNAGGTDNIIPELIKHRGRTLKQRIYNLIIMIRKNNNYPVNGMRG
jgi:hypothetical protein